MSRYRDTRNRDTGKRSQAGGRTCKDLVRDSSHLFLVPLYKSIQSGNKVEAAEGQQRHG